MVCMFAVFIKCWKELTCPAVNDVTKEKALLLTLLELIIYLGKFKIVLNHTLVT